jgi:mRNA interferase RelE/StbE
LAWTIDYLTSAKRELRKLDRQVASRIVDYMDGRIAAMENPRSLGAALVGSKDRLWRYRVGDYRIVCEIHDARLIVLVVRIGHRSDIYR